MPRVGDKPPAGPKPMAAPKTAAPAVKPKPATSAPKATPFKSTKDVFEKQKPPSRIETTLGAKKLEVVRGQPGGWAEYGLVRPKDNKPLLVFAQERVTVEGRFPDKHYDGQFIGREGAIARGKPLSDMRGVRPDSGTVTHKDKIVFVNGILTSRSSHEKTLKAIANRGGAEVIGLYNATDGFAKDGIQTYGDKLGARGNPATDTLAQLVYGELKRGSAPLHIMAHSQGGASTSHGLRRVKDMLEKDGLSRDEAERRLSRVYVEMFGSADHGGPKGPRYHYYVSRLDPVPNKIGSTPSPGKDIEITPFWSLEGKPLQHDFEEVYLPHWEPSRHDKPSK